MTKAQATSTAHADILGMVNSWKVAVKALNLGEIMSFYAPDIIAFDAIAQLQFKGADAYGKHWKMCLDMCPGPMIFEPHELNIETAGDLAFGHCLMRCGVVGESGTEHSSWMRMTACYRKIEGKWKIAHEHFSAPIDMHTGKVLSDLEPDGAPKVRAIPSDMHSITPHLVCDGAADAIEFYKKAFNATEMGRLPGPDGKLVHASVRIGNSVVMLMDEFVEWGALSPTSLKGSTVTVHLYVENADATERQAIAAGAKSVMPLDDTFWGDRYGVLEDPFGHRWSIATHIRDVSPEEIQQAMQKSWKP